MILLKNLHQFSNLYKNSSPFISMVQTSESLPIMDEDNNNNSSEEQDDQPDSSPFTSMVQTSESLPIMNDDNKNNNSSEEQDDQPDSSPFTSIVQTSESLPIMKDDNNNNSSEEQDDQPDSKSERSIEEKSTYKDDNDDDTSCFEQKDDPDWYDIVGFEQQYFCFPLSQIDKSHLEDGNRIIMPHSAFERLTSMEIEYPMVFKIINSERERASHCGVLEFTAEEGFVFLPQWMMKNLQLYEGQQVTLESTTLSKGTFLKIQPHSMKFFGLSDHKAVLEETLKYFSCLTIGDTIMINHNSNKYFIDILEAKPSSAISVVDTDCEIEFALALDYKEPEKKSKAVINPKWEAAKAEEDKRKEEEPKFVAFTGVARRLDGQPLTAPAKADSVSTALAKGDPHVAADSNFKSCNCPEEKVLKSDNQKFQPFTGKKHVLAG